jgi:hypothetical protein
MGTTSVCDTMMFISDFMIGDEEKSDIYNNGNPRTHTDNDTYLKII